MVSQWQLQGLQALEAWGVGWQCAPWMLLLLAEIPWGRLVERLERQEEAVFCVEGVSCVPVWRTWLSSLQWHHLHPPAVMAGAVFA